MITYDLTACNLIFWLSLGFGHGYSLCRDDEEGFLGVPSFTGPEERDSGNRKQRSEEHFAGLRTAPV